MNDREPDSGSGTMIATSIALIVAVAAAVIVVFLRGRASTLARPTASRSSCISHLLQIQGAKEQWALEQKVAKFSAVDVPAMIKYLKGSALPVCEQGGTYFVNAVGLPPQCSYTNHTLLVFCHSNLEALNQVVELWRMKRPDASLSGFVLTEMIGSEKPLGEMPRCERKGQYRLDLETGKYSCSLGDHGR